MTTTNSIKLEAAFQISLIVSILLGTTVFAYVLLFAIVIMPGIGELGDEEFLHAFQVMDGRIQDNQPIFMLTWMGSMISFFLSACLALTLKQECLAAGTKRWVLIATVFFMIGQSITTSVHIPLNNHIHTLTIDALDDDTLTMERQAFESRWNTWNIVRTIFFLLAAVMFSVTLLQQDSVFSSSCKNRQGGEGSGLLSNGSQLATTYLST